jgi:hypothetical protein
MALEELELGLQFNRADVEIFAIWLIYAER